MDNRLALFDEGMVRSLNATGRMQTIQCVWVYERPIDMEGVRRFHRNFGYGMAGRRIERSPLPFARYRWVSTPGPASPLEVAETPIPRDALNDWIDFRSQIHVDAEDGPGWHIAVQPLDDGATAVCVVGTHCLGDGVGAALAVWAAVIGTKIDIGYPPPFSRPTGRAILADLRETARELPQAARAAAKLVKLVRSGAKEAKAAGGAPTGTTPAKPTFDGPDEPVVMPWASVWIDPQLWDERARALGGNTYALLAGIAARLGERTGRTGADGEVTLLIAMADRGDKDFRANAMSLTSVKVDPTPVTKDLTATRAAVREAIKNTKETPNPLLDVLPLVPLLPRKAVRLLADTIVGADDLPVTCSNVGMMPEELTSVDGTPADFTVFRGVDQGLTRRFLEHAGGQLVVVSVLVGGKINIGVEAYQPGAENSKARLRELVAETLAEFELTGEIR
ncbi:molecular chaperone TorD family protein [Mycolicibacterium sp. 120266]|uniref:molecular chaperone TorD family protein n=1 Tax=Mycolicibacterium sp. 120266 TaxID=3090601 RepID=UPI00299DDA56|nr:molecular chaperone TorD family protein [Mycolicibacterium sp. 120266]MDX1872720.1 molecular chaperone TorD family protein [Mycolicibacterium sp. 120266]